MVCDIFDKNPIGPFNLKFDVVSSFYCANSVAKNKSEWQILMANIASLVKPNGILIGASMKKCEYYKVDGILYPSANIDANDIQSWFTVKGYKNIKIVEMPEWYSNKSDGEIMRENRHYDGLIGFYAELA